MMFNIPFIITVNNNNNQILYYHSDLSFESFLFAFNRTIVIPANAFDSKAKFLTELRSRFGSGILNMGGGVTASILTDYYAFLKEDLISLRQFFKSNRLGFQENDYWLLSREVRSVKYGKGGGEKNSQIKWWRSLIIDFTINTTINKNTICR